MLINSWVIFLREASSVVKLSKKVCCNAHPNFLGCPHISYFVCWVGGVVATKRKDKKLQTHTQEKRIVCNKWVQWQKRRENVGSKNNIMRKK